MVGICPFRSDTKTSRSERPTAGILPSSNSMADTNLSSLIWSVADLLRGDFKQSEYGRVILPFTVLRRLDCVLAPTKGAALKEYAAKQAAGIAPEPFVKRKTGLDFYNVSSLDMGKLMGDQDNIRANLESYIQGFAQDVRSIFEHFDFAATVERLHKAKLPSTSSRRSSHASTCTPSRSTTCRWAWCSRS